MKKRRFVTASVICLVGLATGLVLSRNKTDLIIVLGIRGANAFVLAIIVISAIALAVSFLLFLNVYRKRYLKAGKPKPKPKPKQNPEPAAPQASINNEEYVRGKLEHFIDIRPRLINELRACLTQMDSINEKQASLSQIRLHNDTGYLQIVTNSLDKAKLSIWNNMLAIINIAQIWDPKEAGTPGWAAVYDERRKEIKARIDLNDNLLRQCAILMTKGTTLANDKSLSRQTEAVDDLEATTKVIDQLRDMSGLMEGD